MGFKRLYIFVEGPDDVRFFEKIIKPTFKRKYDLVELVEYAEMQAKKVDNYIRSIKSMDADYIYLRDINNAPCVTAKKQGIQNELKNIDENKTVVLIKEIESWYLAGLDNTNLRKFGITLRTATDNIIKEQFNDLIPKKIDSRIDFMLEILKCFSIATAKNKNKSFRYFLQRHDC